MNPQFTPAMRDLAVLYFEHFPNETGTFDLANLARRAFPDDPDLANVLGVLSYQRADYRSAAQYLKQSLRTRKTDPEVFYYLGLAQYHANAKTDSKLSLEQALTMNPEGKLAEQAKKVLAEMK